MTVVSEDQLRIHLLSRSQRQQRFKITGQHLEGHNNDHEQSKQTHQFPVRVWKYKVNDLLYIYGSCQSEDRVYHRTQQCLEKYAPVRTNQYPESFKNRLIPATPVEPGQW